MVTLQEIFEEIKCMLKKTLNETEDKIKEKLKRVLNFGIVIIILVAILISLFCLAALSFLVGSFFYLYTFLPIWLALVIMGFISIVIAVVTGLAVYIIIRKKLSTNKSKQLENRRG